MRSLCFALILAIVIIGSNGWVARKINEGEFDGYCYGGENDNLGKMKVGETRQLTLSCGVAKCSGGGDVHYTGCGVVGTEAPCKVVDGDQKDLYPKCCKQVVCPESNSDSANNLE